MANNTRNPLGSSDPRDLFDNSSDFDEGMNSTADTFLDRFGRPRYTWNLYEKMTQNALDQVQETVDSAKGQVNAARDDGIQNIGQSVSAVDAAEESAIASMEETAANLGDDLNTKSFKTYSEMLNSPQTRDGVVGIVDGDPDPNLNGWYQWSNSLQRWSRIDNQPLIADTGFNQDTMFALLDSARRETWLGVNSRDGGPTVHAERLLRLLFGMFLNQRTGYIAALTDANGLMTDLAIRDTDGQFDDFVMDRMAPRINQRIPDKLENMGRTGYLFALRDANGLLTDLCVDDVTGQFPQFVIERMARRMSPYIGDSAWRPNDKYTDQNGDVQRVFANMLSWSGWGSSTIDEWSELGSVASSLGATYYNGGNGATELQHNLAQMGARPALLLPAGGSIPASGQVVVTCSNVGRNQFFKATTGTLQGVPGTLNCTTSDWIFTRAQAGDPVTVSSEQPFIPTQGLAHRGELWLMQQGKNNINNGTAMAQIIAWHKQAYNWNSAFGKRVIVMTHFGNNGWSGTEDLKKVQQLNDFIRSTYTDSVFDLQAYLCSNQVWSDTGITPTQNDLDNQAVGCLAASLSRDNLAHMNAKTRAAAAEIIKQKLLDMGWFKV
ncbi:hypothetical protein [Pseudomonas fulva]|uniref:hypothetical protein n=1 Tax=Pseudomonas fulva TaxID=47880 RepID=UPI003D2EFB1B